MGCGGGFRVAKRMIGTNKISVTNLKNKKKMKKKKKLVTRRVKGQKRFHTRSFIL